MNSYQSSDSLGDILIVDDEPNNLRVLSTILSDRGYDPRGVLSGPMALKAAKAALPDLILLDIMMPDLDGYEVCQKFKADTNTCEIPIIFISAKDQGMDKVKAFAAGGVDYITKPFQFEEVLARIENHLNLRKLQQELAQQNLLLQTEIGHRKAAEQALQQQNERLQQEICDRQSAEAALQKANQELARSNSELEQFASIASHDLLSPISTISGYAQLLKMCYSKSFDEKSTEYIDSMIQGCDRMQTLINDLLAYSRLGREKNPFVPIDCQKIFTEACQNLSSQLRYNQATVTPKDLPTVIGDRSQLLQLFQNLIGNAIKYRGENTPIVQVTAALENNAYLFAVKDNGIGIEPENFQKVFQMFKRLHGHSQYPGTGIGLAICQKIVENHGGRIWVESECDRGSTFYFTLPCPSIVNN